MIDKSVAIIGVRTGGLSLAITLKQAGFTNIQIFDRTSFSCSIGANLVLWPNATRILSKIGLDNEIQEVTKEQSFPHSWLYATSQIHFFCAEVPTQSWGQ